MATAAGVKDHKGKVQMGLIMMDFARALKAVAEVGQVGIEKYYPSGWITVPNGESLYTDAMMRHFIEEGLGNMVDPEDNLFHAAHTAWNALARLDLMLRALENMDFQEVNQFTP